LAVPFLGELKILSFNFPPKGWAFCNGQLLPIQQYTALFSLIGTYYGGNGTTTFALPNLQSRVPAHVNYGGGAGLPTTVLGQTGGEESVTLQASQVPAHVHLLRALGSAGTTEAPAGAVFAAGTSGLYSSSFASPVALNTASLPNVGGGQPHTNLQPYLVLSVCIALSGVYPSRN
jgi:microcystin-dependent protein